MAPELLRPKVIYFSPLARPTEFGDKFPTGTAPRRGGVDLPLTPTEFEKPDLNRLPYLFMLMAVPASVPAPAPPPSPEALMPPAPDSNFRVVPISRVVQRPLSWLWPGRLALGKLALLDGDPGLGKSLVTLDLCARLSTGRPFPDGSPGPGPASSIILNGEDGDGDTIRPRLQALGADLDRVFVLEPRGQPRPGNLFRLPDQAGILERSLSQTRALLVVIDPIMAFLDPSVVAGSDPSVRRALFPLAQLAERHRCVILWSATSTRAAPAAPSTAAVAPSASSAPAAPAGSSPPTPGSPTAASWPRSRTTWPRPSPASPTSLQPPNEGLRPPCLGSATSPGPPTSSWRRRPDPRVARRRGPAPAISWRPSWPNGPRTSRDIWAAAQERELTRRTLQRASKLLDIRSVRICVDGKRRELLAPARPAAPRSRGLRGRRPDLEPWLAPLREQFPPSTPLDDPD